MKSDKVELTEVHVIGAYWQGDPAIPPGPVLKKLHFVLQIKEWFKEKNVQQLYDFSARATKGLTLKSEGHPDIRATLTKGTIAHLFHSEFQCKHSFSTLDRINGKCSFVLQHDLPG